MSWREKLNNKVKGAVEDSEAPATRPEPRMTIHQTEPTQAGWRAKMTSQAPAPPAQTINIADDTLFPALGGGSAPAPAPAATTKLTGYVNLTKKWADHAKEEEARLEAERIQRAQQEIAYNLNAWSAFG